MVDTEQYQLELETLRDTISAPMATATTIKPMAMPWYCVSVPSAWIFTLVLARGSILARVGRGAWLQACAQRRKAKLTLSVNLW